MEFSHYRNINHTIKNEEEGVQSRRFVNEENYRLIQFLEGNLEELKAEDFGDATSLDNNSIFALQKSTLTQVGKFDISTPFKLTTIEIGDSIERIGENTTDRFFSYDKPNQTTPIRIIFPKNFSVLYGRITSMSTSSLVLDFSKLSYPPAWIYDEDTTMAGDSPFAGEILVPSAKLSSWKKNAPWSYMADQIKGV